MKTVIISPRGGGGVALREAQGGTEYEKVLRRFPTLQPAAFDSQRPWRPTILMGPSHGLSRVGKSSWKKDSREHHLNTVGKSHAPAGEQGPGRKCIREEPGSRPRAVSPADTGLVSGA